MIGVPVKIGEFVDFASYKDMAFIDEKDYDLSFFTKRP